MRTLGQLDVDKDTKAVTSFVCTNTVVQEEEGKHLINLMKRKFTLMINNGEPRDFHDDTTQVSKFYLFNNSFEYSHVVLFYHYDGKL